MRAQKNPATYLTNGGGAAQSTNTNHGPRMGPRSDRSTNMHNTDKLPTFRTNLGDLLGAAYREGRPDGVRVRASSWTALRESGATGLVTVFHYDTAMFRVDLFHDHVIPVNPGWGSVSDKQGVGKILRGYGIDKTWADLFDYRGGAPCPLCDSPMAKDDTAVNPLTDEVDGCLQCRLDADEEAGR